MKPVLSAVAVDTPQQSSEVFSPFAPPWVRWIALLSLCSAYLLGGIVKATDFSGATAEMQRFGLSPPAAFAGVALVIELGCSALILTGYFRWFGALLLGAFTLVASFIANRYWELPSGHDRFMVENGFFEHLGLVGGFLLVAWHDLRRPKVSDALVCW